MRDREAAARPARSTAPGPDGRRPPGAAEGAATGASGRGGSGGAPQPWKAGTAGGRCSSGLVGRRSLASAPARPAVLLVRDVLQPVDRLAVERFVDGDVLHGGGRGGAVPV